MAIPSKSDRPGGDASMTVAADTGFSSLLLDFMDEEKGRHLFSSPSPFSSFSISSLGKVDFVPRSTPLFCLNKFLAAREGRGRDVHGEV